MLISNEPLAPGVAPGSDYWEVFNEKENYARGHEDLWFLKPLAICHYTQNTLLGSLKQNHKFCCHITCVFWKGPLGEPEHWEQFLSALWVIFFIGLSSTINGLSHPFFSGYGSNPAKNMDTFGRMSKIDLKKRAIHLGVQQFDLPKKTCFDLLYHLL